MEECIFCKIVKGEVPCYKVYEDDKFLAFLDIKPVSIGHTLLIPKNHHRWVYEVPEFSELWQTAKKLALALKNSSLNPEYITFLTIGNEISHAHIHLIPRSSGDSIQPFISSIPHLTITEEKFLETVKAIKNSIEK